MWLPVNYSVHLLFLYLLTLDVDASFDVQKPILSTKCDKRCLNGGSCANGSCVCLPGWTGPQCQYCFGRVIKNDTTSGFITSSAQNYAPSSRCTWIIDSPNNKSVLNIKLERFQTECSWDHVYIYDGDSVYGNQLGAFSGDMSDVSITAKTGKALIYFTSDLAHQMGGFNISYTQEDCMENCSGNGDCRNHKCICHPGYTGEACEHEICSNADGAKACQNGGSCGPNGTCKCKIYFHGERCQEDKGNAVLDQMMTTGTPPEGIAGHAAILMGDSIWIFGGASFKKHHSFKQIYVYNTVKSSWVVKTSNNTPPRPRYDHSVVQYKDLVYIYGGVTSEGNTTNELWSFNTTTLQWTMETASNNSYMAFPQAVAGHTAHVINNEMYVFFGYNIFSGFVHRVQIYSFDSGMWHQGDEHPYIEGRYGHSSVLYSDNQHKDMVIIYGGYNAPPGTFTYAISDQILFYDYVSQSWTVIKNTKVPLFRHSATLINGIMIVIGGNGHNESNDSNPAVHTDCYSSTIYAFDVSCQEWFPIKVKQNELLARYAHAAVSSDDHVFVIGGFNSRMLRDVVRFKPADCKAIRDPDKCRLMRDGTKCIFVTKQCTRAQPFVSYASIFSLAKNEEQKGGPTCGLSQRKYGYSCGERKDCASCFAQSGCVWCTGTVPGAGADCVSAGTGCVDGSSPADFRDCRLSRLSTVRSCSLAHNCYGCRQMSHCSWFTIDTRHTCISVQEEALIISEQQRRQAERLSSISRPIPTLIYTSTNQTCPAPCAAYSNCQGCMEARSQCMWCPNAQRCVSLDTYMISFPFGQCHSYVTVGNNQNQNLCKRDPVDCRVQKTCTECQLVGAGCGWCDDGSDTGLGMCLQGSAERPLNATCPPHRWYYTGQPKCQCNGHSKCDANGKCNCEHNTKGPNCGTCAPGFYGEPENGGTCKRCECYDPEATCNPVTGDCYCTAKGVTGTKCEKCEPKYYGDPKNGKPCLYDLSVDFIFTFKIDTDDIKDKYVKEINFFSIPCKKDTDVQFTIVCDGDSGAKVSINMTSSVFEGHSGHTQRTLAPTRCDKNGLRRTYVPSDPLYPFGTDTNTTFLVKVDSFSTPIRIQISFAQSPPINWVLFFVIFAACFIVLLVVAGLLWMIKLRVEVYRRNQRRYDEIEQMASRPFASVRLELASHEKNPMATPVSVEPLSNYRYGIYTLAVRLPTGGKQFTPHGTSGLAVASALCLLNQSQLAVLQAPDSSESGRNRKNNFRRFFPFMRS